MQKSIYIRKKLKVALIVCCNDGTRPVLFKLRDLKQKNEVLEIIHIRF